MEEINKAQAEAQKANTLKLAVEALRKDPVRAKVLFVILGGGRRKIGPVTLINVLQNNGDLFVGTNEEVKQKLRALYNKENVQRLYVYLGRIPRPLDFLLHRSYLEDVSRGAESPEARKLKRIAELLRGIKQVQPQVGGRPNVDPVLLDAIKITGVDSSWLPYLRWIAERESSFDPTAVNPASKATGLFQTLPSTFRQYALPGYDNIYDPLHNAIAAIRYIQARYGHPSRIPNIGNWTAYRGY